MITKSLDVKAFYAFIRKFVIINITKLHKSLWSQLYFNLTYDVSAWLYCHSVMICTKSEMEHNEICIIFWK